jgi:hypothetical protein
MHILPTNQAWRIIVWPKFAAHAHPFLLLLSTPCTSYWSIITYHSRCLAHNICVHPPLHLFPTGQSFNTIKRLINTIIRLIKLVITHPFLLLPPMPCRPLPPNAPACLSNAATLLFASSITKDPCDRGCMEGLSQWWGSSANHPHPDSKELGLARTVYDRLYMTVYLVYFLPRIPYFHCIYIYMVLVNPTKDIPASIEVWCGRVDTEIFHVMHCPDHKRSLQVM